MNFADYQNQASSEKITLATLEASKRLMGWTLHSGSVYKIENFAFPIIMSIKDSGNEYALVGSIGAVTASKYFFDTATNTIYLRASDSSNPNSRFIVVTIQLNYSNIPVVLPSNITSGPAIQWEPFISSTSEFGVEMDTVAQSSEAIEGSGNLTLLNDQEFWPANFDKLSFENQLCRIYAYNRELAAADARLIFKGYVDKKTYSSTAISFSLKDEFSVFRSNVALNTIGSLGARTGNDLVNAKQRMILGRVFGHVPTNIDQVLDGYPLTGTVSISSGSLTLTGSGTIFKTQVSPDDSIVLGEFRFEVASVNSDTSITLSQEYNSGTSLSGVPLKLIPSEPKRYMNRIHKVAGHALRQPTTVTASDSTINKLRVVDSTDIYPGDLIYIGTLGAGESAFVNSVYGSYISLSSSLAIAPVAGVTVTRPAVQNVRIGERRLSYYTDYTFDASTAVLTLNENAEANVSPVYQMGQLLTFTNGSSTVTGSGFEANLKPGYKVGIVGSSTFQEILSIESDTSLTLRSPSIFSTGIPTAGRYKPFVYDPSNDIITLDALGRTDDGLSNGVLLKTAPSICKALLQDMGLTSSIDSASFSDAESIAYQHLGMVIPSSYSDSSTPTYREVMNSLNISVFGSLIQNTNFQFQYNVLRPEKTSASAKFSESDVLSFSLASTAEKAVLTTIVEYRSKEHDYLVNDSSIQTTNKSSDTSQYILKIATSRTIKTKLVDPVDANIVACRWSFILQTSIGRLNFTTKLQGITLQVGDIIEIEHRKFYERLGDVTKRKLLLVESVKKTGSTVSISATDLSNAFNKVASINSITNNYASATDEEKLYGGFITDQYGLMANAAESIGTNLIW